VHIALFCLPPPPPFPCPSPVAVHMALLPMGIPANRMLMEQLALLPNRDASFTAAAAAAVVAEPAARHSKLINTMHTRKPLMRTLLHTVPCAPALAPEGSTMREFYRLGLEQRPRNPFWTVVRPPPPPYLTWLIPSCLSLPLL